MMKRKIQELRNLLTGEELIADKWLCSLNESQQFELRRKFKRDYKKNKAHIVCAICNFPVYLAGNADGKHYFKHWKELGDCRIKTRGKFAQKEIDRMKYNGARESRPHIEIKEHLYKYLSNDPSCSDVNKEKVIKSSNIVRWWKKPDLSLKFQNTDERIIKLEEFNKKLSSFLNALYSAKHGKIIGYKFQNFVALSNFMLEQRPEFTYLYLWSLSIFGRKKDVEKAVTFKKKVKKYKSEKPEQSTEFDSLIEFLFPELKEKINRRNALTTASN